MSTPDIDRLLLMNLRLFGHALCTVGRNLASHQQPGREVAGGVWVPCALPVPPAVSLTGGAATPTGLVSRVWLER